MSRKVLLLVAGLLLAMLPVAAFSQIQDLQPTLLQSSRSSGASSQAAYFAPGTLSLRAGVGLDLYGYGFGLGLYPGLELTLAHPVFGGAFPMSFGVAGRAVLGFDSYYGGLEVGAGGFGTAHFSFKDLNLGVSALDPLDIYIGLGVVFGITGGYYGYWSGLGYVPVWFSEISGINWFLNKNFALTLEYSYLGFYSTTNFGILLKL